ACLPHSLPKTWDRAGPAGRTFRSIDLMPEPDPIAVSAFLKARHDVRFADQHQRPATLIFMSVGAAILMAVATVWDRSVTSALPQYPVPWLTTILQRSFFEGDLPGANDLSVLLIFAGLVIYILGGVKRAKTGRLQHWRPVAGFILTAGLVVGLIMVHGLKYFIGRARPVLVFDASWPYSFWFEFGPHTFAEGLFNASFPSGHTAQAFLLMAAAYALAGDPLAGKRTHAAGWIWGAFVVLFSLGMGWARCVSRSHWLTDVLGAICLGFLLMHWLYHHVLRVPEQRIYWAAQGCPVRLPRTWEIMLCLHLLMILAGAVMAVQALRILFDGGPISFGWMLPIGLMMIGFSGRTFHRKRCDLARALGGGKAVGSPEK
ncbi:MAG: phosphatase PAP2 family protein, partial [Desulfatitalea sp.]|nr:phosphatase PAP2 family protein [Desulfatitalea sp.]